MNKEEPYRDQAERLKQRIEKINDKIEASDSLPPREQIHRQKKKKIKWKIKYPVLRLLALFFIFLPIIIFSVMSLNDKKHTAVKTTVQPVGYETINLEKPKNTSEKSKEIAKDGQQSSAQNTTSTKSGKSTLQSSPEQPKQTTSQGQQKEPQVKQPKGTSSSSQQQKVPVETNTSLQAKNPPAKSYSAESGNKVIFYTVQPKETLFGIARKYYRSPPLGEYMIKRANFLNSNQIEAGQVLKIPLN